MMHRWSLEDYPHLDTPVLLLLGDRDKMVSLEETQAVYRSLPKAFMGMLPVRLDVVVGGFGVIHHHPVRASTGVVFRICNRFGAIP